MDGLSMRHDNHEENQIIYDEFISLEKECEAYNKKLNRKYLLNSLSWRFSSIFSALTKLIIKVGLLYIIFHFIIKYW